MLDWYIFQSFRLSLSMSTHSIPGDFFQRKDSTFDFNSEFFNSCCFYTSFIIPIEKSIQMFIISCSWNISGYIKYFPKVLKASLKYFSVLSSRISQSCHKLEETKIFLQLMESVETEHFNHNTNIHIKQIQMEF